MFWVILELPSNQHAQKCFTPFTLILQNLPLNIALLTLTQLQNATAQPSVQRPTQYVLYLLQVQTQKDRIQNNMWIFFILSNKN